MKKKLAVLFLLLGFVFTLTPALAQNRGTPNASSCTGAASNGVATSNATFINLLCTVGSILNSVVPILVALGVVYFVYGVITYVIASDEEAKKAGRDRIIYGIIAFATIVGLWGLVAILGRTFGVSNPTTDIVLPTVNLRN